MMIESNRAADNPVGPLKSGLLPADLPEVHLGTAFLLGDPTLELRP